MMIPADLGGVLFTLLQQLYHLQLELPRIGSLMSQRAPPWLPFDTPHLLTVYSNKCVMCQIAWYGSSGVTSPKISRSCSQCSLNVRHLAVTCLTYVGSRNVSKKR